jgi:hypothetical protein
MQAILWIAFFLTVWIALAIWTVRKSRGSRTPLDREKALRLVALHTAGTSRERPHPKTF